MSQEPTNRQILSAINQSFGELEKKIDGRFNDVDNHFNKVDERLKGLERGQEEIKLRLGHVVYTFELQELKEIMQKITNRVEILERKI